MRRVLLTIAGFALSSGLAWAVTFEEVDANQDGIITSEEAAIVEGLDFSAADTDADNTLSMDEYQSATGE
jgi:hypothetical protein